MIPFSDIERDFAWAVLDGEASVPGPLVGKSGRATSGKTVTRRFAVYRNNVYAGLIEAKVDFSWEKFLPEILDNLNNVVVDMVYMVYIQYVYIYR